MTGMLHMICLLTTTISPLQTWQRYTYYDLRPEVLEVSTSSPIQLDIQSHARFFVIEQLLWYPETFVCLFPVLMGLCTISLARNGRYQVPKTRRSCPAEHQEILQSSACICTHQQRPKERFWIYRRYRVVLFR